MKIDHKKYENYLPDQIPNGIEDLSPKLEIFGDDKIECWYAPLGKINTKATIALYGITPGWTQMQIAYRIALRPKKGDKLKAMSTIAFAGSMRKNLIEMFDELGVHRYFQVDSFADLFGTKILAYSSILKYPVFSGGKNYNGYKPDLLSHPFLRSMLESVLVSELREFKNCLIIPLGKKAAEGIFYVRKRVKLEKQQILSGFPHPSGANAHRVRQFSENKMKLSNQVQAWFEST
ncbi:hypothetical protein NC796_13885 [Aliifodinibius sp. S!AR15-10]|uniref:hypothetical protein n=1 Tax=Aliifodinibius sp. S!AR15-10 TaxID=2950437 RepID=UPI002855BF33|nr:hypothetical protein [Aliifodinibius sp. S!AR15-10]MDR8392239.1 hypothetical protein [Aliifodinibius sp. S!AR15-10]